MSHVERAIQVWQLFHMMLFAGWMLGTMVTADQPAWFLSGSLGFSHACTFTVVLLLPMTRDTALRQLDEVSRQVKNLGSREKHADVVAMIDRARPPHILRTPAMLLLTMAILGLAPVAWYFANTLVARTTTYTSTTTQALAHELWHNNPGSTITMLTLLSGTGLMHLVDIVVASVVLARGCRSPLY
jgi:hypothetical protein